MAMACRVGEVGEVAKLRRKVWPSNFEGTPNSKRQNCKPSSIIAFKLSSKSGKGYRHRTESLQHVAADPAHCGMVDL